MFKTATVSCDVGHSIIISNTKTHLTSHIAHINKLCYVSDSFTDQPFLQELLGVQVYHQQGAANGTGWWGRLSDRAALEKRQTVSERTEVKLARTLWAEATYMRNRKASPSLFRKRRKRSGNDTQNVSFYHRLGQRCKSVRLLLRHRRLL